MNSIFFFNANLYRFVYEFSFKITSATLGTASSAAADGVGALRSATKSAIVKSVSCPTA